METTYIRVKPDGVQRGLVGEIIGRFERKGLKLVYRESDDEQKCPNPDEGRGFRSSCLSNKNWKRVLVLVMRISFRSC